MVCNEVRKVQYYLTGNVCLWSCNFPTPRGHCQLISNFFSTPAHCYNPITLNSSNLPFIIEKKLGGYSHAVSCVWRLCFCCRWKMKQSPWSGRKKNVNGYVFHSKWHVSICVSTDIQQQRHGIVQHCTACSNIIRLMLRISKVNGTVISLYCQWCYFLNRLALLQHCV